MKHCWHPLADYFRCCHCGYIVPAKSVRPIEEHGPFHPDAYAPDESSLNELTTHCRVLELDSNVIGTS